ncbi:hypothetical protein QUW15_11690 [Desulfovibrio piger]|nr:hypothetical protein [Desulfovibrio piger]
MHGFITNIIMGLICKKIGPVAFILCSAACTTLSDDMLTKKFDLPTHVAFKKELSIGEIKKQLPLQLEETRFLKDISFDPKNNKVTQTIAITNGTREEAYANFSESLMRKAFSSYLCDVNKKNFRNGYENLEFIFLDKNDRELIRIFLNHDICSKAPAF